MYPNNVFKPRRYVVENDHLRRVEAQESEADTALLHPPMEDALPGAASISSLTLNGKDVIVTTSSRIDNTDILSVAVSWTRDALQSPIMMELDCCGLEMESLVAIRAFEEGETMIRLTLVDSMGTFAVVTLNERLDPALLNNGGSYEPVPIQILNKMNYIQDRLVLQTVEGSELQSTMVAFVSSTVAVIALAPLLLTVDLQEKESKTWSDTHCREQMKSSLSIFSSITSTITNFGFGELDSEVMDMPPTAALCLTSTKNLWDEHTYCITIHSDASIRKWRIHLGTSLLPTDVAELETSTLPIPSMWSGMRNSVAMCARLYGQTFALAVHIRTEGTYNRDDQNGRDCNLWLYNGPQDANSDASCLKLNTPEKARSLIGMNFVPTQERCSLSVLFDSSSEDGRSASVQLTYPPSNMAILQTEPVVTHDESNLDEIAAVERTRIQSMMLGSSVLEEHENASVQEALHELDSMYLKYLFRPIFPRGTGTVLPPSDICIRRALAKMVHGHKKEPGMSVELETIRCMSEWRHRENQSIVVAMTPIRSSRKTAVTETMTSPGLSVYESYFQAEEENEEDADENMDDADANEQEIREQEVSSAVDAHEKRWRRFMLQVWEEEKITRFPLCVSWLHNIPLKVTVRAGITTATDLMTKRNHESFSESAAVLDGVAVKVLRRIENDRKMAQKLYRTELELSQLIASAQLATAPIDQSDPLLQELNFLARWAWRDDGDDATEGLSDREHESLEQVATSLSSEQLVDWILNHSQDASRTLAGLDFSDSTQTGLSVTWSPKQVANAQLRHAACSLSVRCIDTIRRLQLGRCLLVLDLVEGSNAREAALRSYLHTISVLWATAQRVPMPMTALQRNRGEKVRFQLGTSPESKSPPKKRLSFGDDACGILAPSSLSKTTILDVSIIEISQTMDESLWLSSSPIGAALRLGQSFYQITFGARDQANRRYPSLLRELCALPRPKKESGASDYPHLALRLLAPCVAFSLPQDSADVVIARKETVAECLLIESNSKVVDGVVKSQMRTMACELLVPQSGEFANSVEKQEIHKAFAALKSIRNSIASMPIVTGSALQNLVKDMGLPATSIEIRRLCELKTVKDLFSPLTVTSLDSIDNTTTYSFRRLANVMLHLSRVIYRIRILERHVGTDEDTENSGILLDFISSAIKEMKKTFPDDVYHSMDEYVSMWSSLFSYSVHARHWRQAYTACVRNPKSDRRESNFKRLVRAMVDAGALSELLNMCSDLVIPGFDANETVDLYQVASEILAESISRDFYTLRASSPTPSNLSDFQGALYALHASQKQWRRAAQSMDLRYLNARMALSKGLSESTTILRSAELRDGLIVEDMVLASVASMISLQLVREEAHRFLISGEYGPYNAISIAESSRHLSMREKRNRGSLPREASGSGEDKKDRLSNFMTCVQLEGRAIRASALRVLYFDRSSDRSFASAAFLRDFATSDSDVEELFKNGYYRHGLLLAKAWSKNYDSAVGCTDPNGQGLFYDSLVHLLDAYVVPRATYSEGEDTNTGTNELLRPSVQQLAMTVDNIGESESAATYIIADRYYAVKNLRERVRSAAAMALTRKLTIIHSSAETALAVDVATCFLDQEDGYGSVPGWLERLLTGADVSTSDDEAGLFARRPKAGSSTYLGDPSALISLYSKYGLFAEACDVVTSVLTGLEGPARETNASSRLPETGDIDFVPYRSIDILSNLIDIAFTSGGIEPEDASRINKARDEMVYAVEKHFSLMKLSEMGMKSARALKRNAVL